jgi:large subunit ribosomal protein L21
MYAIIRTGGRQFRAEVGQTIDVERLPHTVGESFTIEDVLLIGDGEKTVIGQPTVEGASVKVTVQEQFRGDKVIVFKYRQRTNYRVKRGHRQYHTRLHVDAINVR